MSTVRILHLSDLQSGNLYSWWAPRSSWNVAPTYGGIFHKKLVDALQKAADSQLIGLTDEFAIDVILVTGDVAERGKASEYDAAWAFLNGLRQGLQQEFYTLPKVFIIPGNHDIDRDADRQAENKINEERFGAKLSAYNRFVEGFDPSLCTSLAKPFVSLCLRSGEDLELRLVGLNSCMKESYRPEDHYGWVGDKQLGQVRSHLGKAQEHPYVLRIAAFHHNPLLIGHPSVAEIEALFSSAEADTTKHAAHLRNYLHDSEKVLENLANQGFALGLHGHQHFDGVLNIHFPGRFGEPFVRSSIALIGAGSAGLRHETHPQPSITSAQLLTVEAILWGWRVMLQRMTIRVTGLVQPDIRVDLDEPKSLILPRAQPLEPIAGVNDCFRLLSFAIPPQKVPKDDWPDDEKPEEDFGKYILWEASDSSARIHQLDEPKSTPDANLPKELLADLRTLGLYGIRAWAKAKRVYGNDQMLALRKLQVHNGEPYVAIQLERFAQTRIINWVLPQRILEQDGQAISFRKKWLLKSLSGADFVEKHPYLSWRNEVTVLATVQEGDSRDLIVRIRSRQVSVEPEYVALFTAGGCRPVRVGLPDGSWISDAPSVLRRAALNEMDRETGLILPSDLLESFRLIALYLDPMHLTPVWLYWLDMTDTQFEKHYEEREWYGRDEWEGWDYRRISLDPNENWEALRARVLRETRAKSMSNDPALGLWVWLQSSVCKNMG